MSGWKNVPDNGAEQPDIGSRQPKLRTTAGIALPELRASLVGVHALICPPTRFAWRRRFDMMATPTMEIRPPMARIHITIEIPKDGPAQVSITTDDRAAARPVIKAAADSGPLDRPTHVAQISSNGASMLRTTREARGWSQRELATRIGCSATTIAHIEQGRMAFSGRMRTRIEKAGIVLVGDADNAS